MARAGILYSDVARAATELAAKGEAATVDNVRKMMGDTGSKSTIAPMLKRWKEEHQDEALAAKSGLPESILNAVRGVYALLQSDCENKIIALTAEHDALIQAAKTQQATLSDLIESLTTSKITIEAQLAATQEKLGSIEEKYSALQLKFTGMQSEKEGLTLRLDDRSQEVKELKQKNEAMRHQFEHFQTATANQRADDRRAYEARMTQIESELQLARKNNQTLESTRIKQEAEIQQLLLINAEIANNAQKRKEDLEALQIKHYQTDFLLQESKQENLSLKKDLSATQQESQRLQTSAAVSAKLQDLLTEQLKQSEIKTRQVEEEKQALIIELIKTRVNDVTSNENLNDNPALESQSNHLIQDVPTTKPDR
ncbi:MAG: DNA-binding protein [Burkholderiaceae bacterium]|nr:DNA-binding protein [Burkholderiaceae bacterium]